MNADFYGPKPGGPTHPSPSHPAPTPPPQPLPQPTRFRPPAASTPLNTLVDCARAWGAALVGIARLLTGRPV